MQDWQQYEFETRAVRAGQQRSAEGEHSEALFLTSSYVFDSAAQAAARFAGTQVGNIYSRFTNPTVRTFEQRLAAMEGGEACIATASGMAAICSVCMGLLKAGDHVVASQSIFGTTLVLFSQILARFNISTSFVALDDVNAWQAAIRPETKLLFLETPSNPLTQIGDIQALAQLAHDHGCLLAVDNCFCTPALQQPLALGADLVVHSATKYLDGQGRCLGGAVVGRNELIKDVYAVLRTAGFSLSPFNAWVFLKGLETLKIRMEAHSRNALALAQWLATLADVTQVHYCGLPSHAQYERVLRQQTGFGGLLSFEVKGGQPQAWSIMDNTRLLSITANLGDAKTTLTHPATTTHGRLTPEQRAATGIGDGLIRVAVGLENIKDIQADLLRGF